MPEEERNAALAAARHAAQAGKQAKAKERKEKMVNARPRGGVPPGLPLRICPH